MTLTLDKTGPRITLPVTQKVCLKLNKRVYNLITGFIFVNRSSLVSAIYDDPLLYSNRTHPLNPL